MAPAVGPLDMNSLHMGQAIWATAGLDKHTIAGVSSQSSIRQQEKKKGKMPPLI